MDSQNSSCKKVSFQQLFEAPQTSEISINSSYLNYDPFDFEDKSFLIQYLKS